MSSGRKQIREFGKFRLDVEKKVLWFQDEPVSLPLKEIELLCVLTEKGGEVITRDELLEKVWAESFVEESNLSRHIYLLRKTFKDFGEREEWIQTVPRRGYRFTSEVRECETGNGECIIEKHSLTQTFIQEIQSGDAQPGTPRQTRLPRLRAWVFAGLLLAVVFSGLLYWRYLKADRGGVSEIKSIAVLPLKPLGDGEEDKALSLGMTDALITRMGSLRSIIVRSVPMSSLTANPAMDAPTTGKALGVEAVLEGSLQRAGRRIRVTLRLFKVRDGMQIWSGYFDETEADIFKLQDAISSQVAQSLSLKLNQQQRDLLAKRYTENVEAYQAYLRGRFFFDRRDRENYDRAIGEFEHAIALDPNYALAYSGLSDVYAFKIQFPNDSANELHQKAKTYAEKALALDNYLAEAYASLGWVNRLHEWDWESSERNLRRALELNPQYANARQWYAQLLLTLGRSDEALIEIEKAQEIDPLAKTVLRNKGRIQTFRRETAELIPLYQQIAALEENKVIGLRDLAMAYERVGNDAKTIEIAEEIKKLNNNKIGSTGLTASLAIAYARLGHEAKSREMLAELEQLPKNDTGAVYQLATIHSALGDKEKAIALLQKCFAAHDDRMLWIKVEPRFDALRDEPRFQEILRKMRLAD
jgi:DNA-binding winged helix-turn-helix (wHTH) protein/TolB-like protein/Flp pilus assembly protein TadD